MTSVMIGEEKAMPGDSVLVKSTGHKGTIQQIGRHGLVALRIPENPILASRVFSPAELEIIKEVSDEMTNGAAIGYMIMAGKSMGLDEDTIKTLEAQMKYKMDMRTEEEAEKVYQSF